MTSLSRAARLSIELRFWVACCVTFLTAFCNEALGLRSSAAELVTVCLSTLALYNLDGSLDAPRRGQGDGTRRAHLVLTGIAVLGLLATSPQIGSWARWLVWSGLLVCGAYAAPLGGSPSAAGPVLGPRRLKSLPGLKAPFVGFAVGSAVVWVPLLSQAPEAIPTRAWLLTLVLGLCCSCNALLFDVPDVAEDREQGVPTIAVTRGATVTKATAAALAALAIVTGFAGHEILAPGTLSGLVTLAIALILSASFVSPKTSRTVVALGIDGALILPWLVQRVTA